MSPPRVEYIYWWTGSGGGVVYIFTLIVVSLAEKQGATTLILYTMPPIPSHLSTPLSPQYKYTTLHYGTVLGEVKN